MAAISPFVYESKRRFQSKTLWGISIALAGMAMQYFGVSAEGQNQAMDLITKAVELIGLAWAWYGREVAQKAIK